MWTPYNKATGTVCVKLDSDALAFIASKLQKKVSKAAMQKFQQN